MHACDIEIPSAFQGPWGLLDDLDGNGVRGEKCDLGIAGILG